MIFLLCLSDGKHIERGYVFIQLSMADRYSPAHGTTQWAGPEGHSLRRDRPLKCNSPHFLQMGEHHKLWDVMFYVYFTF